MIAGDHNITEAISIQAIKNAQRFDGLDFSMHDYALSIKCRAAQRATKDELYKVAGRILFQGYIHLLYGRCVIPELLQEL